MTRSLRIEYPNAYYHVTCRGNARQNIFFNDSDRRSFLSTLERSADLFGVNIIVFVLMDNHFHLLVKTPRANLSVFMRHFNVSYTVAFNRRNKRTGHLYQGRYKANLVDAESYLLEVSRYIHLNSVRARKSLRGLENIWRCLISYTWSSFPGYVKSSERRSFIHYQELLLFFGTSDTAARQYAKFVIEGVSDKVRNPFDLARGHGMVGDSDFVQNTKNRFVDMTGPSREQPQLSKLKTVLPPEELIKKFLQITGISVRNILSKRTKLPERSMLMELLYRNCQVTQQQVGFLMGGIDYSAVSLARKRLIERMEKNEVLMNRFNQLEAQLIKNQMLVSKE